MAEEQAEDQPALNINEGDTVVLGDNVSAKPEIKAQVIEKLIINVNPSAREQNVTGNDGGDGATANRGAESDSTANSGDPKKFDRAHSSPEFGKSEGIQSEDLSSTDFAKSDVTATILEELSRNLIKKSEHVDALRLLKKVLPMRRHNQLMARLMIAECHIHLNRSRIDILNNIHDIKEWLVTSSNVDYEELQTLADSYQDANPVRALILRYCMDCLGDKKQLPPDDAAEEIWEECLCKTAKIITSLSTSGDEYYVIASETGIPLMVKMLDNLRAVPGTDANKTAVLEAKCSSEIGACYCIVGETRKAIAYYTKGLEVMKRRFQENASVHKIFRELEEKLETVNQKLEDKNEAE